MRHPSLSEQLRHQLAETTEPSSRRALESLLAEALRVETAMHEQSRLGKLRPTLDQVLGEWEREGWTEDA